MVICVGKPCLGQIETNVSKYPQVQSAQEREDSLPSAEQDQGPGESLCAPTEQTPTSGAVQQAVPQGAYDPVASSGGSQFFITHWTVNVPYVINMSTL